MKYQYILNGKVVFETNDASEYCHYLMTNKEAQQVKYSVLYNLLVNSKGYTANMVSA